LLLAVASSTVSQRLQGSASQAIAHEEPFALAAVARLLDISASKT
jgi:hypothetical protein